MQNSQLPSETWLNTDNIKSAVSDSVNVYTMSQKTRHETLAHNFPKY